MQPITPNEVLEDGAPIYIRRTITKSVILRRHVIIIRVCAVLQLMAGLFAQTAFICITQLGLVTSPFGIVTLATGIIGLVLSFRVHLTCLNTTFMVFSIATAIYALPMMALTLPNITFCDSVGVGGIVIANNIADTVIFVASVIASVLCCLTNVGCRCSKKTTTVQMLNTAVTVPDQESINTPLLK